MTLVALANALLDDRWSQRFHADPRVQATELLLQERVPRQAPITAAAPGRGDARRRRRRRAAPCAASARRTPRFPHAQFLSNGNYTAVVTNAGGGASFCRGRAVTRRREDPTRDPGSQFLYLRDVRSGAVWSATYHPTGGEPDDYLVTFRAEKATFRRRDDDIATQLDIAVSTEDDVEVRRLAVTNHGDRAARDRGHELRRDRARPARRRPRASRRSASCSSRPSTCRRARRCSAIAGRAPRDEPAPWAVHVLSLEGRPQGPVEWETDRARFLGRGRGPDDPAALDGRSLSGHDRRRARSRSSASASASGSRRAASCACRSPPGMAPIRETALALAQKYRDPSAAARDLRARLRARAERPAPPRHLSEEALLFERLASRVLYADGSLRAAPDDPGPQRARPGGALARTASPATCPILLVRVVGGERRAAGAPGPAGAGVLAAQGAERGRGHPERASDPATSTRCTPQLTALLDDGPWRTWKHRPGGAYLLRGDGMTRGGARRCWPAVARAVLSGDRGELRAAARPAASGARAAGGADGLRPRRRSRRPADGERRTPSCPRSTLANGRGGFTDDGRDYVIVLDGDQETPLPWVNVIANPALRHRRHRVGRRLHLGRRTAARTA